MLSLKALSPRRWSWLVLCAALFALVTSEAVNPGVARADEEAGAEEAAAEPAEGEAAPAAPAQKKNFLAYVAEASGIFGLFILIASFIMVALIAMNLLQVRRDNMIPPDFIEAFEERLTNKDYQGAYEIAKNDESYLAKVLAAGLSKLNKGYSEAVQGMQEVGEEQNMALEHRLGWLAMIATVSPMLGLMGTVQGMIMSFEVIAQSTTAPKPNELAMGISTALYTTIEGLIVAIPAMIFYGFLRNRVARYTLEVGRVSESLMSRFSAVGKKSPGGAAAPAPAAPEKQ